MSTSIKKYHHGDLRQALLKEGATLIQDQGLEAFTLRKLAQRLQVSAMALYRHYPDKETLLAAIAADGFTQLQGQLEAAEQSADTASPLLKEGIAYVLFALEQPALFRLMFGASRPKGQFPELDAASAGAFAVLMRHTHAPADDETRTAQARGCWALVHGLACLLLDGQLQMPANTTPATWLATIIRSTVSQPQA